MIGSSLRSLLYEQMSRWYWAALGLCGIFFCATCVHSAQSSADINPVSKAEFDVATDEWQHHRYRTALDHAMRAIAADENNGDAHHFAAILYLALCQSEEDCRLDDAEKAVRKALEIDPENREAKHTLGTILVQKKNFNEAVTVLESLANDLLYRTPKLAWYELALAYLGRNESDKALEALKRAKAADPLFCFADYAMGLAYEQKGAFDMAVTSLTNAVNPPSPVCQNNQEAFMVRGRVYARLQNKVAACADFAKCLSFAPNASSLPTTAARECGRLQVEQSC